MGDFQLTTPGLSGGWRQTPNLLGDYQLKLDPDIQAELDQLSAQGAIDARLITLWTRPKWSLVGGLLPPDLSTPAKPDLFKLTPPGPLKPPGPITPAFPKLTPPKPLFQPGDGPDTPRAGKISDVLEAVYGIPVVKQTAEAHLAMVGRYFAGQSTALKVTEITAGVTFVLSGYLLSDKAPYTFITGQDISVPGVDGLKVKFDYSDRGAGVSWSNIGGSPFSVQADGKLGEHGGAAERAGSMMLTFDVTKVIPALK